MLFILIDKEFSIWDKTYFKLKHILLLIATIQFSQYPVSKYPFKILITMASLLYDKKNSNFLHIFNLIIKILP